MPLTKSKWPLIGILVLAIIILVSYFGISQVGPYDKKSDKQIMVDVPSGSTINSVSKTLYEKNLIKNRLFFRITSKISQFSHIKAGKYLFTQKESNIDILKKLSEGKVYIHGVKVTIPEGSTYKEVINLLVDKKIGSKENYEKLINDASNFYDKYEFLKENNIKSLEGFLYPNTYYFDEKSTEKEIVAKMLDNFKKIYTDALKQKQKEMKWKLEDIIILSSIVEKEAVKDQDRPIIASVFYNRLSPSVNMPLQSDATIQYIFEERKKIVTYNDLKIQSPYNSYIHKGLPPTPICSPGVKSIEATLNPETTDYLYFVATIDGGNAYSKTYSEHLKNVEKYKSDRDKLNTNK